MITLCLIPPLISGCLSVGESGSDATPTDDSIQTETPENNNIITPEEGCEFVDRGVDPKSVMCLVEQNPPDLRVDNKYTELVNISVFIDNNNRTTYSKNISLRALEETTLEDVITSPGNYTIQGVAFNESVAEINWKINERYERVQWVIRITAEKDIRVFRVPDY